VADAVIKAARHLQKILDELGQIQPPPRLVRSPEDLEALAHERRQRTDHLGRLWGGSQLQQALEAVAWQVEQERLVSQWPQSLKNDGRVQVRGRTAQGPTVPVWVTSYRRQGQRRAGKRDAGVSADLVLLGIQERCPPAWAAAVSLVAAMLGSLAEAQAVWAARGVQWDTKTIRTIA
jgi:hypothetical protein